MRRSIISIVAGAVLGGSILAVAASIPVQADNPGKADAGQADVLMKEDAGQAGAVAQAGEKRAGVRQTGAGQAGDAWAEPSNGQGIRQALESFRAPADSARTKVWWFHGETPTTREGITADLEAYKAAGIGGVYVPSLYEIEYHADRTVSAITPKNGAPARRAVFCCSSVMLFPGGGYR